MDEFYKNTFGFQDISETINSVNKGFVNSTLREIEINKLAEHHHVAKFSSVTRIMVSCLMIYPSIIFLILPTRHLHILHLHVASFFIVFFSFWANILTPKYVYKKYENFKTDIFNKDITWDVDGFLYLFTELQVAQFLLILFCNLILQCCLAIIFERLQIFITNQFTTNQSIHKVFTLSFIIPTLIALLPGTWRPGFLNKVTLFSTLLPICCAFKTLLLNLITNGNLIYLRYNRALHTNSYYETIRRIQVDLNSLNTSSVLRMFWAIRVLVKILYLLPNMELQNVTLFGAVKYLLIKGSDSIMLVMGMTSYASYFCCSIGTFFQWVLITDEVDDGENIESMSAYIFFVLAIQNMVTDLDQEERLIKIYYGIYLLCAVTLCHIHEKVNSLLISLSSNNTSKLNRHLRPLLVCVFLIVFPITMLTYLWSHYSISPWLLAVSSLYIKIIIKVLVSLALYSLFLIDGYRTTSWEKLDDYVYNINSFGTMVELCFVVFFFLSNSYNVACLSHGSVNVLVTSFIQMFMHMHVYIWFIGIKEWKDFIKRYAAEKIIKSLSDATVDELLDLDDVCSICIQPMVLAKITKCNHYFHVACLRKLLYASNQTIVPYCPLCQNSISMAET